MPAKVGSPGTLTFQRTVVLSKSSHAVAGLYVMTEVSQYCVVVTSDN